MGGNRKGEREIKMISVLSLSMLFKSYIYLYSRLCSKFKFYLLCELRAKKPYIQINSTTNFNESQSTSRINESSFSLLIYEWPDLISSQRVKQNKKKWNEKRITAENSLAFILELFLNTKIVLYTLTIDDR